LLTTDPDPDRKVYSMTTARKPLATFALALLAAVAVLALAGVSLAGNGHGKGGGSGSSAQHQYSSGGKQYGKHRVALCHKGHTIYVAPPAVKAHVKHGDKLGAC
jgi:hypothetical protein